MADDFEGDEDDDFLSCPISLNNKNNQNGIGTSLEPSCSLSAAAGEGDDIDRNLDRREFKRIQLNLFKQRFREGAISAEQSSVQSAFDTGFNQTVTLGRRIGKAHGGLKALLESTVATEKLDIPAALLRLQKLENRLLECAKTFANFNMTERSEFESTRLTEFTTENTRLPDYDPDDMDLFLGEDVMQSIETDRKTEELCSTLESVSMNNSHIPTRAELLANLQEETKSAESLLTEVACVFHDDFGVCDDFVYA